MKTNNYFLHIILTTLLCFAGTKTYAYDIAVPNSDGVTIYYNYINNGTELELQVTFGSSYDSYRGMINIPSQVTYQGNTTNVTSIGASAFSSSFVTSVTIPNSVTSIGYSAFYGCSGLTSVKIGNGVTSIGDNAFSDCSRLTKVIIHDITAWCGIAFNGFKSNPLFFAHHLYSNDNTEIKDLVIPNSVTSIGHYVFYGCSGLTSITIPNSVTSIGDYAFSSCSGLTSITIPNSVTSIGQGAFSRCNKLLTIISRMTNVCTIPENCFEEYVYNNATLYVPQGTTYKYKAIDYWTKFLTIEEGEPSGVSGDGPEKCETPTITYSNGQLLFNTSTEGATCYYTITDNDVTNGCGDKISLCVTYNVKVYAWKSGYQNSDIATGTLCWIDTNPTTEGIINEVTQISARAVFVQANDGFVSISGLGDSERVAIYQTDGKQVATVKAYNGSASVATNISRGTPVIVKIGEKAVKVVMQ